MDRRPYDDNGDMIAREGVKFRQVGWMIKGGVKDGVLLPMNPGVNTNKLPAHGSISPIYVEVGD